MASLTTRTYKINAIISLKDKSLFNIKQAILVELKEWCNINCDNYAFILHHKDTLDNGELKTPHIHLVCNLLDKRLRLSTTLNNLANTLKVPNLAISIDKYQSFEGSIQYLVHKNNDDKYQYSIKDIISNINDSELDVYLNSVNDNISLETLIAIVKRSQRITDVMRDIGLGNYRVYRNVIWDIWSEEKY